MDLVSLTARPSANLDLCERPTGRQLGQAIRRHADCLDLVRVGGWSDRDLPLCARAYRTLIARAYLRTLAALRARPGPAWRSQSGWRPGDNILVDLPDGQTFRCRIVSVKEDGTIQVVPEHAVVIH